MEQEIQLNEHNKQEYPPMHTAEHLLNSQMVKYFHCERSFSAHIEKKKSKCDYHFKTAPSAEDIATVEQAVNELYNKTLTWRKSSTRSIKCRLASTLPAFPNRESRQYE